MHCATSREPIPLTLQIRPRLALASNVFKGGTDEYSRALSQFKVEINGSHPFVKYEFRFIMTQLQNSFLPYRLFMSQCCQERHAESHTRVREDGALMILDI